MKFRLPATDEKTPYTVEHFMLDSFIQSVLVTGNWIHEYDVFYFQRKKWRLVDEDFMRRVVAEKGEETWSLS